MDQISDTLTRNYVKSVRQFRFLEAKSAASAMASKSPNGEGLAYLLDGYHHFLMTRRPDKVQGTAPFTQAGQSPHRNADICDEIVRIRQVWNVGWLNRPLHNLFALSYWSAAQYDRFRTACWLSQLMARLDTTRSETRQALRSEVAAYCECTDGTDPSPYLDLYVGLQFASDGVEAATGGPAPLETIVDYRPRGSLAGSRPPHGLRL